jgi:mono/diheme cytochrome c family protein
MKSLFFPKILLAAGFLACASSSSDRADEGRVRIAYGGDLFQGHCAACHGSDAKGQGPVAAMLKVPPPDLTRIALRQGGHFDSSEVAAFIDGRVDIIAHGRREMPVWGRVYDHRNEDITSEERLLSSAMISAIVAYLQGVQLPR